MTKPTIILNRLISTPEESSLQKFLLTPLTLLSLFYGWLITARVFLYRRGIYKSHRLSCRVVSVGNLTLGGTGKTPFVQLLAGMTRAGGWRTAILSRGYKGKFRGDCALVSDGQKVLMDAHQAGDEPFLLAEKVKGVPVIVGRERRISGQLAIDRFQTEVAILDDGFQHLLLQRDLNLLLIDSTLPFGNGWVFPRGILREPLDQIRRADAIILTKAERDDNIKNLKNNFMNLPEGIPVFRVGYQPKEVRVPGEERSFLPDHLRGKRVLAFSGVARPESFREILSSLEAIIGGLEIFPDHYEYRREDLERLSSQASQMGAEAMITTEKDLVRLRRFLPAPIPLWALVVEHVFLGEDRARFEAFLWGRLGRKP